MAIVWAFQRLHPYLHGTKVQVETDHQPLLALLQKVHPPGRLLRWTLALQEYRFKFIYRKGSDNNIADSLSRTELQAVQLNTQTLTFPLDMSQMAIAQQQDPYIHDLIFHLRTNNEAQIQRHYVIIDNVLHYIEHESFPRICIPHQLQQLYLEFYHAHPLSGHLGFQKV